MIYSGTFFISILSFYTTYKGLCIILPWELALLGSLGLQTAMLGIAWNLIKIKEERKNYIIAFSLAAVFSIFFSYANFDSNLKINTRPHEVRNAYYQAAKPAIAEYAATAKSAALKARYQTDRLADLIAAEEEKGWATIVDEGSRDKFIQSVIDGARLTVQSWKKSTGSDYRQGKGRGIIAEYLESRYKQAILNLERLNRYVAFADSLALQLVPSLTIAEQYDILNKAYIKFPASAINLVNFSNQLKIAAPPATADFAEKPVNRQQALMLVISDLLRMDRLACLSLLLAFAIDFIVILIAFAGSHIMAKSDFILEKIESDVARRLKNLEINDVDKFKEVLQNNLEIYKKAAQYGKDISRINEDYRQMRFNPTRMHREEQVIPEHNGSGRRAIIIKRRSRLAKWFDSSKSGRR